jgi:hypothetical protein
VLMDPKNFVLYHILATMAAFDIENHDTLELRRDLRYRTSRPTMYVVRRVKRRNVAMQGAGSAKHSRPTNFGRRHRVRPLSTSASSSSARTMRSTETSSKSDAATYTSHCLIVL